MTRAEEPVDSAAACCAWRALLTDVGSARALAVLFALFGTIATALLVVALPPFQSADETTHLLRAAQVADGGMLARRVTLTGADGTPTVYGGGDADPAVFRAYNPFHALHFHPEAKAVRRMWEPPERWTAERVPGVFPNTAAYPPFFYMPGALGVLVGRGLDLTVVQTLYLARALTGAVAVAVGTVAVALAGAAAPWLFAVLTLPMSLALIPSTSQDALLLAGGALVGALLLRVARAEGGRGAWVGLVATLALVAMARPPYGALALVLLAMPGVPGSWRMAGAAIVAAAVAAWSAIVSAVALTTTGAFLGADPQAQVALLLAEPWRLWAVAWTTLDVNWGIYVETFIGRLGWLDTVLPRWYRDMAVAVLGVALLGALLGQTRVAGQGRLSAAIGAGALVACGGLFAIQYLTWTKVGAAAVDGVQGRYFLPLALVGAAAVPSLGWARLGHVRLGLVALVAAFPVLTLAVVMRVLVLRYYLG